MKKLKLYGIRKGERHNVFHIEKDEGFLKSFGDFLFGLGFDKMKIVRELFRPLGDFENNYSKKKYSDDLYQDEYFYFENKEFDVDIFFGKDKIIVSIFTRVDYQQKIMDEILKFCYF